MDSDCGVPTLYFVLKHFLFFEEPARWLLKVFLGSLTMNGDVALTTKTSKLAEYVAGTHTPNLSEGKSWLVHTPSTFRRPVSHL